MYCPFEKISVKIYGESHAEKIGVILSGVPKNTKIDTNLVQAFVDRRKSGNNVWSTPRKEEDKVVFVRGVENGEVIGEIEAVIYNNNVKSKDYGNLKYLPRPSHADYVSAIKDKTGEVKSGGGRFSGRLTAPMVIAGGIAKQILKERGIEVCSYVRKIGNVEGDSYKNVELTAQMIESIPTRLKALSKAEEMEKEVLCALADGDSIGGVVDVVVFGLELGYGDSLFEGLEGRIASAVYAVPAVKGVEFGLGFGFCEMRGSSANDPFIIKDGKIITKTNNSGGINGGISNGMPITLSVAFRPTPSISKKQKTVDINQMIETDIEIKGRHDACIAPRGAVAVESAVALSLLDIVL